MRPLVIDNFAGGGGASTGIEAAIGRPVDVAINHDPQAVAMHAANHPATRHFCQSIMAVDPLDAIGGAPVALAWFSPDCKHHSKAKGGKPREKNIRDLAWVVIHWVERLQAAARQAGRPDWRQAIRVVMLENVEEFRRWGPLDADGHPIKERQGEEFHLFVRRFRRLGGRVEHRELVAADHGAPTSRKRLYMVVRFDGLPIVFPAPSHGRPGSPEVLAGARAPWRTAAEIIDWSLPCPSIFTRDRELKDATKRRIAHGVMRYVVNAARPFIVPVKTWGGGGNGPRDIEQSTRTTTTSKGGEFAVVDAAIVPITHSGGERAHSPAEPLRTVTTASRGELAAVGATLVTMGYGERPGQEPRVPHLDKPLGAAVAGGLKHDVVTAHLEKFSENSRGRPADAPLDTAMAGSPRHAIVTIFLSSFYKRGGKHPVDAPLPTAMAGSNKHAVVCAHMEQANTGMVGHAADRPLSTVVGRGTQQRLVETTMVAADALPPDLLARATRTAAFLIKYYGSAAQGQPADQPLHTVTTLERFAVVTVTIDAATYVLVDIGMRMLTPRELARAQGFPDTYILAAPGPSGKPLTKTAQIRMIGNSVCPDVAAALVRANLPDECAAPVEVAA